MIQALAQDKPTPVNLAPSPLLTRLANLMATIQDSQDLRKAGDAATQHKDWKTALNLYQQALGIWKDNSEADYGIANCYHVLGDSAKEVIAYRAGIYKGEVLPENIRENDISKLMQYALLLNQSSQVNEALFIYHYGAANLNYMDGKQHLKVLLPAFGNEDGLLAYSSQRLQALAHLGMAISSQDDKEKEAQFNEAIRLQPDMPQAYYYKGQLLSGKLGRNGEALAAYQKARHFSDIDTQLLIDQTVKDSNLEKVAASEDAKEKHD